MTAITTVLIAGQNVRIEQSNMIGEGGEAEVFKLDAGCALKLFKQEDHPQFKGDSASARAHRRAARSRLDEMQSKLPAFPTTVPGTVVAPRLLARDNTGRVVGYTMPLLSGACSLRDYTKRAFREANGISNQDVSRVFESLHETVSRLHAQHVVIGDLNPLNVLVKADKPHVIDSESMQFAGFKCKTYTPRYTDPLICSYSGDQVLLSRSHTEESDWYAFALMVFECLLFVHPYGGVYKPKSPSDRIALDERPFRRISVLHQEVLYPKAGIDYRKLPGDLQDYYSDLLLKDRRGQFPLSLLTGLTTAVSGSMTINRASVRTANGASAKSIFSTKGTIVAVTWQSGEIRYLYHEDGKFRRENRTTAMSGALQQRMRFKLTGEKTIVSGGSHTYLLSDSAEPRRIAAGLFQDTEGVVDTNSSDYFYVSGGQIWKNDQARGQSLGDVLAGQTRLWVGEDFGFGLYKAREYTRAFLFDLEGNSRTNIDISPLAGRILNINCHFGENCIWLLCETVTPKGIINSCSLYNRRGELIATSECLEGEDSWLGSIHGKCSMYFHQQQNGCSNIPALLSVTSSGIVKVAAAGRRLKISCQYPDTRQLVTTDDHLIFAPEGLYVWNLHEIKLVRSSGSVIHRSRTSTAEISLSRH